MMIVMIDGDDDDVDDFTCLEVANITTRILYCSILSIKEPYLLTLLAVFCCFTSPPFLDISLFSHYHWKLKHTYIFTLQSSLLQSVRQHKHIHIFWFLDGNASYWNVFFKANVGISLTWNGQSCKFKGVQQKTSFHYSVYRLSLGNCSTLHF